jgi:uncharacterized protein (DUF58 family)
MPLIPTPRLVLLAFAPLLLGIGMAIDSSFLVPMLAARRGPAAARAAGRPARERPPGQRHARDGRRAVGRAPEPGPPDDPIDRPAAAGRQRPPTIDRPRSASTSFPSARRWPRAGARERRLHLSPSRRGAVELGDHHVRYPSPLGLWQRQLRLPAKHVAKVYPDVAAVRVYELLAARAGENLLVRAVRLRGG